MANPAARPDDHSLTITRIFDAPRERVFDAWLNPAQWIGPRTIRAETLMLEPKVGGRYLIHMKGLESGDGPKVSGTYREFVRPERLVFTWAWEPGNPMVDPSNETLVTLTFRNVGKKTEMTLHHENFVAAERRDSHNQGWTASLDKLAELLAK